LKSHTFVKQSHKFTMHTFYSPDLSNGLKTLDESESKHCVNVLRLKSTDKICLVDGKGGYYLAQITIANPRRCEFEIIETQNDYGKRSYFLHIAIAPTKSMDRFEWFLEKSVEIGIDEITPLLCSRSERKRIKPERIEKIILSAMKQSIQAFHPKLNGFTSFKEFINSELSGEKIIAHCGKEKKPHLKEICNPGSQTTIMIGPEGDFTSQEVEMARKKMFLEADLGSNRLRTETAGLVACITINLLNQAGIK